MSKEVDIDTANYSKKRVLKIGYYALLVFIVQLTIFFIVLFVRNAISINQSKQIVSKSIPLVTTIPKQIPKLPPAQTAAVPSTTPQTVMPAITEDSVPQKHLNTDINLESNDNKGYFKRGYAYYVLGQYELAINDYDEAIHLKPDEADEYNKRAKAYYKLGQYQRAIEDYNESIRLNPSSVLTYNYRGNAYLKLAQYNRAQENYNKAISLEPDNPLAYYNYACMLALQKNTNQSCKWLQKAIDKGYKDWDHIFEDKDFDDIRNSSCFITIFKKAGK